MGKKQKGGSSYKPFSPKPVIVNAHIPGCQNAGCDAFKRIQNANNAQNALNNNELPQSGGSPLSPAQVTCPQSPMYGMSPQPGNGNEVSCAANGAKAQQSANAQYDSEVGKLAPGQSGGKKRRKKHRKKSTRSRRKSKKSRRKSRKSTRKQKRRRKKRNQTKRKR